MQVSVLSANIYVYLTGEGEQDDLTQPRCGVRPFGLVLIPAPQTAPNHRVLQKYSYVSSNDPQLLSGNTFAVLKQC
jgi:hypothetical protein